MKSYPSCIYIHICYLNMLHRITTKFLQLHKKFNILYSCDAATKCSNYVFYAIVPQHIACFNYYIDCPHYNSACDTMNILNN